MADRSETGTPGAGPANLLETAQRLTERALMLPTLLDGGVADGSAQLLLDVLADGYLCTSSEGVVLRGNQALVHLIGRPLEDLVGTRIEGLVAAASEQFTVSTLVAASTSTILAELQLTAVTGEPVPVVACVVPSHVDGERHWLVAELAGSHARTTSGSSPFEDFFQMFLHDLRAGLYVASGFIELLLRRDTTFEAGRRQEMLEIAMRSLRKIQDQTTATRMSQRAQPAELRDTVEEVDLAGLIGSVLTRVDPGGKMQLAVKGPLARRPTLHRRLVARSMEALLENVLRHDDHGTVIVSLGPTGEHVLTITEADRHTDGTERASEHDPSRSVTNGAPHLGGLSSGLAILSHVARAHGGRAWVEASTEGDARFHLELHSIPRAGSSAGDTCP